MSGKKDKQPPRQDLSALESAYRIVGELSARDNVREYLATRIEDGADVRVLVEEAPPDDAGNALALYAADVNLLAGAEHRNLIPIREGRWVSQDLFAVVTDRCQAPTLETLIARGDSWAYPRIATILHELNGLLEWARDQKVVHRALTLSTVHLEPGTDRVLASFVARPLTRQGAPGAEGDARTIAELAWTLITRGRELPQTPEDSIGIVRPELPRRVIEATDALMHGQRVGDTEPPTVPDFIATVGMTEAIMRGEINAAELEATLYQEQMLEREAWAEKERDYQAQIAERDRQMAEEREEMARTLAAERETLASTLATERDRTAAERASLEEQMADERQRMAEERAALVQQIADERVALEKQLADERTRMAEEREELVRELRREREELLDQLAQERAELQRQVASEHRQLAEDRATHEREASEERERLARDRAEHEAEIANERAAMAATIAEERAQMEQRLSEERARLEATMAEQQQRLLEERTAAEAALAAARAEFETQMATQRQELDTRIAREREAFEQEILAERSALEAEKENFAVFNAAERETIEGERRALEELYLAYEAEGHVVVDAEAEADAGTGDDSAERQISVVTAALADYAPVAVPTPRSEPAADPGDPAETEAGLTRTDAKRSRRAAWGIPASMILLVGIITATAVGLGADDDEPQKQREEPPAVTQKRPAATPEAPRQLAAPAVPTVIDSAGGTVATPDSIVASPQPERRPAPAAASPQRTGSSPPGRTSARVTRAPPRPSTPAPARTFDTAVAAPPTTGTTPERLPVPSEPVNVPPSTPQTFPPVNMPTATPTVTPTAPRDTAPTAPLPTLPPSAIPQPNFPAIPPRS